MICDEILEHPDPFRMSLEEAREWKLRAFREAFELHYSNCPEYQRYCKLHGVSPADLHQYDDLVRIQPVPSDAFRDSDKLILSVPEAEIIEVLTTSSTTSKRPVRYALDQTTFDRMNRSNAKLWQQGHELAIGSMFFLGPPPEESDTGLVRGGYLTFRHMGFDQKDILFAVRRGKLDAAAVLDDLASAKAPRHLYGPPFAYIGLLSQMEHSGLGLKLDCGSRAITTGGWKGVGGEVSRQDLFRKISERLGIASENVRDGYGSTDILTMLPECRYHRKHVPPWAHVSVRDPGDTSIELPEGEIGLVVLMASWIQSYPAFTMPGDMGTLIERECECGRRGQIVEFKGRARGSGARGCAIRMEEFMEIIRR